MEAARDGNTDAQGGFTARGLAPGDYNATAQPPGHAPISELFTIKPASHTEKSTTVE
jgi:hypothetical protein